MSNPKRVWDSKKRTVRQGKEQVWLVDGEKKVNTNHGFAEATGEDVVYDGKWEAPQQPLQTYEKRWEEIPTPTPSRTIYIDTDRSSTNALVGDTAYFYVVVNYPEAQGTTCGETDGWLSDIGTDIVTIDGIEYQVWHGVVTSAGTNTFRIIHNVTGESDSIQVICVVAPAFTVNEHTIAYYPLVTDIDNYATNEDIKIDMTSNFEMVQADVGYSFNSVGDMGDRNCELSSANIKYAGIWYKEVNYTSRGFQLLNYGVFGDIQADTSHSRSEYINKWALWHSLNRSNAATVDLGDRGEWHHIAWTYDEENATISVYNDGNLAATWNDVSYNYGEYLKIISTYKDSGEEQSICISDVIIEDQGWSTEKIQQYYNATKSNYPYVEIQTLTCYNESITLSETTFNGFALTCTPANAEHVLEQLNIYSENENILTIVGINLQRDPGVTYINVTTYGVTAGTTNIQVYLRDAAEPIYTIPVTVTPFIHVESISSPSTSSVTIDEVDGITHVSLGISPSEVTDASMDVTFYSDDAGIAEVYRVDLQIGQILIIGKSAGTTQVHYYLNSDSNTVYDIDVTVAPEQSA